MTSDVVEARFDAVNNHGGFGRWAFVEVRDAYSRKGDIRDLLAAVRGAP